MKVIGLLSFYEEPVGWLAEVVTSAARAGVDHIVAVDGAYGLYPRGLARSNGLQHDVLVHTAAGCNIGLALHVPGEPWRGNEVEKRDYLFRAGQLAAEPDDWFIVLDADEVVLEAPGLRQELASAAYDAADIVLVVPKDQEDPEEFPIAKLFRAYGEAIRVVGNHFTYLAPDGRYLWTYRAHEQVDRPLLDFVRIEHRVNKRPTARMLAKIEYYRRRDEQAAEVYH